MEQDAGITRDDRPGTKLERLRRLLQRTGKLPDESVALFGELLGLAPMENHAVPDLSPQQKKAHIFSALLVQMEGRSGGSRCSSFLRMRSGWIPLPGNSCI